MRSKSVEDRIRSKAFDIWQFCQDRGLYLICDHLGNERPRTAQDDWLEAEAYVMFEVEQERSACPKCKSKNTKKIDEGHGQCDSCGYYFGAWIKEAV